MRNPITVDFVKIVALALGELNTTAVFVGGATVPFYLPDDQRFAARATEDVDVVIEIIQSMNRHRVEEALRKKGFRHDMTDRAPLCLWLYNDTIVDIMSPEEKVLGFSNKWYADGIKNVLKLKTDDVEIKILKAPYFLATKFEAFKDRGRGDFYGSKDMEDIITLLDVTEPGFIEAELKTLDKKIATFLKSELETLLNSDAFRSALPGSVVDRSNSADRANQVVQRIRALSSTLSDRLGKLPL